MTSCIKLFWGRLLKFMCTCLQCSKQVALYKILEEESHTRETQESSTFPACDTPQLPRTHLYSNLLSYAELWRVSRQQMLNIVCFCSLPGKVPLGLPQPAPASRRGWRCLRLAASTLTVEPFHHQLLGLALQHSSAPLMTYTKKKPHVFKHPYINHLFWFTWWSALMAMHPPHPQKYKISEETTFFSAPVICPHDHGIPSLSEVQNWQARKYFYTSLQTTYRLQYHVTW